ncbi:YhgE/Pip domain-containing protein [Rhodococcus sp. HM1]|uniref:YhgE/Pip domain-containing protein n=1 Tax=Rhodococcus sp. HM1 TaxID=2937759 RepID=UPI00200AF74D|nr:YhgE/Pip domain-containing protein [Rhodococcus sp. HM1]MCK8670008.1 YhgE/Pip domain-containing protein [Rhodococcus sp. HM1]
MLAGLSPGSDLERYFRGRMPRMALAVLVLMPLLYGAMYLWAFWNPFGEADKIPVALVNADRGTIADGKPMNAGDQVAKALIDSGQLDLTLVSVDEAKDGVASGKYYFSVTLPENFSEAVESPNGDHPEQAQLIFTYNDANNYLATVIGQDAAEQVVNQVNAQIGEQGVGTVLTGMSSAGAGLEKAASGAEELAAGLVTANNGAQELATNMVTARDGAAQLSSAIGEIDRAVDAATDPVLAAMGTVSGSGADPGNLGARAAALGGRIDAIVAGQSSGGGGQQQAVALIDQALGVLGTVPGPQAQQIADALGPVRTMLSPQVDSAALNELSVLRAEALALAAELNDPASPLRVGLTLLQDNDVRADIEAVRNAAGELDSGAAQLSSGLVELTDGAAQLAGGTEQLVTGAQELASGLDAGVAQIPQWTDQERDAVAKTLASPVALTTEYTQEAPTFGTGFSPFFMSLSLFVGGIITWMLLTPLQSRPIAAGVGSFRVVLASYAPALAVGFLQALILYLVVHLAVGLKPVHALGTFLFLILVSATFLAMIQAFNAVFGEAVGRVVTLAFLMLQLVSAGGIYPVETTAKPFQYIHHFDPMSYTVTGLRQLTVGGIDSRLWISLAVLIGILAASLTASALSARRDRQYTMDRLYPTVVV